MFIGTSCKVKKTNNDAKGIITFNPTYLIKVIYIIVTKYYHAYIIFIDYAYISSISKFLSTESLEVQASNTINNI